MTALARRLQRRGHEVVFLALEDNMAAFEAAGVKAVEYHSRLFPPGEYSRRRQALSRLRGREATEASWELHRNLIEAVFEGGVRVLNECGADTLVTDEVSSGFDIVASHLSLPFFLVSSALHADMSGYTPLCVYDWPYETGPNARERYRRGVRDFIRSSGLMDLLPICMERAGLPLELIMRSRALAHLHQVPKEFDFPSGHWPANFYYCGPLIDIEARQQVAFPWERLTGEPLIYASLGTLQDLPDILQTIIQAVAAPGRQLVIATVSDANSGELGAMPENTIVWSRAPQLEILKRSALCITHAGLNTALESLYHGVPMVAIPITFDQPGVAARIAYSGTGEFIPLQDFTRDRLRGCVEQVLAMGSRYREKARKLQQAIQSSDGVNRAADVVEEKMRNL